MIKDKPLALPKAAITVSLSHHRIQSKIKNKNKQNKYSSKLNIIYFFLLLHRLINNKFSKFQILCYCEIFFLYLPTTHPIQFLTFQQKVRISFHYIDQQGLILFLLFSFSYFFTFLFNVWPCSFDKCNTSKPLLLKVGWFLSFEIYIIYHNNTYGICM